MLSRIGTLQACRVERIHKLIMTLKIECPSEALEITEQNVFLQRKQFKDPFLSATLKFSLHFPVCQSLITNSSVMTDVLLLTDLF